VNIVHVCRSGWPAVGGLESSVGGLARMQAERGHTVRVVTLDRGAHGRWLPPGLHGGVHHDRLPAVGPRRYPFARGLVGAVCGADVVHAHALDGLADTLVATRARHRVPVGVSTHGGYFHTPRHRWLKAAWLRTGTRRTLRNADAVWFTSAADQRRLAPAGARGTVIGDGVDVDVFSRVLRAPEAGRWLVPGRIDVHKGLDDLIDVLGLLAARGAAPRRVVITGEERVPGLRAALMDQAARAGVGALLLFTGSVSREALASELARTELAVFPSRYEGFGIAAVEAMAAAVPVAVADIAPLREHVDAGAAGLVVPFCDPERAATALMAAHGTDLAALASRGQQRAQRHGWPAVATAFLGAYAALVAQ